MRRRSDCKACGQEWLWERLDAHTCFRHRHETPAAPTEQLPEAAYNFDQTHSLKDGTMQTAPVTNGHATVKRRSNPAKQETKKFLGQLNPKLRDTVEALQKLYRKK